MHDGRTCGQCYYTRLGAQVAREMIEGGEYEDVVQKWTAETERRWKKSKFFQLWVEEQRAGRDLRQKVELWLAWKRVEKEIAEGTLGGEFDRADQAEIQGKVGTAEDDAKDEVWGGYRYAVLFEAQDSGGLKTIDLGAGHSSSGETLCGRIITALKSQALLNESVGAGYLERKWPPALKESGAWPLTSLRQSFLNGSLTRLLDYEVVLTLRHYQRLVPFPVSEFCVSHVL